MKTTLIRPFVQGSSLFVQDEPQNLFVHSSTFVYRTNERTDRWPPKSKDLETAIRPSNFATPAIATVTPIRQEPK